MKEHTCTACGCAIRAGQLEEPVPGTVPPRYGHAREEDCRAALNELPWDDPMDLLPRAARMECEAWAMERGRPVNIVAGRYAWHQTEQEGE